MAQQGYKVDCCFFDWPQGKEEQKGALTESGCTLHLLPNPKSAGNYVQKLITKARVKKQLKTLVQKEHELVCINQGGLLDVTYPMYNGMLPYLKNFVLVYHNYNETQLLPVARKRRFNKWADAALQNMVAAEKICDAVQEVAGFKMQNIHVLINPITIPVLQKPAAWPTLNENGNYVWVTIGQLEVGRKAQDILIVTLAADKWKFRNWELHIYGSGPDVEFLSDLIHDSGLQNKIFLKGHSNNVARVLESAHILFQVTHFDAMPLSVTEAMNMARPCIVSNTGDMPLWIRDEEQGYVVQAVAENSIDITLERVWAQQEKWQQLGINAFNTFHQKYPMPYEPYYQNFFAGLMQD